MLVTFTLSRLRLNFKLLDSPPMRYTFSLYVEFQKDLRGKDKRFITEQLKEIAAAQDMHSFGYEDDDLGRYAFFARPDLVDERKDQYEVGAFREVLRLWLGQQQNVAGFELEGLSSMDTITPTVGSSNNQGVTLPRVDIVMQIKTSSN